MNPYICIKALLFFTSLAWQVIVWLIPALLSMHFRRITSSSALHSSFFFIVLVLVYDTHRACLLPKDD